MFFLGELNNNYVGFESLNDEQVKILIEVEMDSYKNNINSYNNINASYNSLVTTFSIMLGFLIAFLSLIIGKNENNQFLYAIITVAILILLTFMLLGTCLYFFRTKTFAIESNISFFDVVYCDTKKVLLKKYNYYKVLNDKYDRLNIYKNIWLRIVTYALYVIIMTSCAVLLIVLIDIYCIN